MESQRIPAYPEALTVSKHPDVYILSSVIKAKASLQRVDWTGSSLSTDDSRINQVSSWSQPRSIINKTFLYFILDD